MGLIFSFDKMGNRHKMYLPEVLYTITTPWDSSLLPLNCLIKSCITQTGTLLCNVLCNVLMNFMGYKQSCPQLIT